MSVLAWSIFYLCRDFVSQRGLENFVTGAGISDDRAASDLLIFVWPALSYRKISE